jgi:hypothetical protein
MWKNLDCGVGEGWRRSVGPMVPEMKKYYIGLEQESLLTVKRRKDNWIGHILRRNCFLKQVIEGKIEGRMEMTEDEEEDVSNY